MLGHLAEAITQRGYGLTLRKIALPTHGGLADSNASGRSDGVGVIGQGTEHDTLRQLAAADLPPVVWGPQRPGPRDTHPAFHGELWVGRTSGRCSPCVGRLAMPARNASASSTRDAGASVTAKAQRSAP